MDEIYYYINSNIDEINRTRQDYFQLERNIHTKYWSIRVNTSILGMNDVDTFYLGKNFEWRDDRSPAEFY